MQRREFITLLGGAAAAWPLAARAQQRAMPVVGYITTGAGGESGRSVADFRTGLADAGYVEGKNVMIEFRSAPLGFRRQRELIAELVDRNVSVIVAVGGSTLIQAATSATSVIPIVFVFGGDPLAYGFVEKLNRPGGNVTGVTTITNVLWSKRLDLLREMAPQATTIGYIAGSSRNSFSNERDDVVAAAQTLGREVLLQEISAGTNLDNIFQSLVRERGASALIVGAFTRASRNLKAIVRLATYHKVPAMFPNSIYVRAGGLMSYGAVSNNLRLAAAQYVARILKGEKPADLPVQQATHFKLTINLKTAKTLGLEVPTTLLTIADEVIE